MERARKQEQEPAAETVTEVAPNVLRMQLPIRMPGLGHPALSFYRPSEGLFSIHKEVAEQFYLPGTRAQPVS